MSEIKLLWEIQQLGLRKTALERQLRSLPAARELKKLKGDIEAGQEALKIKREIYDSQKKSLKQKEDEAAGLRAKIESLNEELYSGEHNNAKELAGITAKLDDLKEKLGQLDDETIGLLEEAEDKKQTIIAETAELNVKKDSFRQLLEEYQAQKNEISAELDNIIPRQEELTKGVTAENIALFRDLQEKYPAGIVIASAEKAICAGCHMGVSFDIMKQLKADKKIIYCDHCGRILLPAE